MLVKRKMNIAFMILSVFILQIASLVQHHHHDDTICVAIEHCEQDNAYNDQHTSHRAGGCETSQCVNSAEFLLTVNNNNAKVDKVYFNPLFLPPVSSNACLQTKTNGNNLFNNPSLHYLSADIGKSNGLRAPPIALS